MEIRPVERLILSMLCDITDKLEIKGETDTDLLKSVLYSGHDWALDWEMTGIVGVEVAPASLGQEVADIMEMHDFLEVSYDGLTDGEKADIDEGLVRFEGFDGNNETRHMSAARLFLTKMDRFQDFKRRDMNSHMPTLDRKRRMLEVYEPLRAGTSGRRPPRLSASEIKLIAEA